MEKNIIKKIIFILIIVLAILFSILGRRAYIVNRVLNLAKKNDFENYHVKLYTYNTDSTNVIEVFKNNDKRISNFKNLSALYQSSSYVDDITGECIQIITTENGKKAYTGNIKDNNGKINIVQDWIYSFNTVTENDVIKPSLDGIEVENR